MQTVKHDWYQTEVAVVITVLVKNLKQENLKVQFEPRNVKVEFKLPDENREESVGFRLAHEVVPEQCSYKISPSKVLETGISEVSHT